MLIYSFYFTVISCDATRAWGLYYLDAYCSIPTFIAALLLALILAIFIYNKSYIKSYIKDFYHKWGTGLLLYIFYCSSLLFVIKIFYILYLLYILFCTLYYALLGQYGVSFTGTQYAIADNMDFCTITSTNPLGLSKHVFLISGPNDASASHLFPIDSETPTRFQSTRLSIEALQTDLISKKAEVMDARIREGITSRYVTLSDCGIVFRLDTVVENFGYHQALTDIKKWSPQVVTPGMGRTQVDEVVNFIEEFKEFAKKR